MKKHKMKFGCSGIYGGLDDPSINSMFVLHIGMYWNTHKKTETSQLLAFLI